MSKKDGRDINNRRVEKFHLSLKWKLGLLLCGFAVVMGIIILLNFRTSYKVTGWLERVNYSIFPQFSESQYLLSSFERLSGSLDDVAGMSEMTFRDHFTKENEVFLHHVERLLDHTPEEGKKDIRKLRESYLEYSNLIAVMVFSQTGWDIDTTALTETNLDPDELSKSVSVRESALKSNLEQMVSDRERWVQQTLAQTQKRVQNLLKRSLVIGTLTFSILLLFSIYLIQRIIQPIASLSNMTTAIAKGQFDLNMSMTQFARDEIGQLATSFRSMTEGLKKTTVSKEYVDNIILTMADTLVVLDPDRNIQMVNSATLELLGYTEDELVGEPFEKILIQPEVRRESVGQLVRDRFVRNIEGVYRAKNGETINISFSRAVMCDEQNRVVGIVCVAQDISDRILIEETLRQAKDSAEAASRAKSVFLTRMSHELRTPLNSVIGFTNVVSKDKNGTLTDKDKMYLGRILSNGKHLLHLINDLLDLSKIEAGKSELIISQVNLRELITETVQQLEGNASAKSIELIANLPDAIQSIETDGGRLKQILINLIGNAIKFTEKGSVTVRVPVEVASGIPIRIDVIDQGVGIERDRLEAIFEAFQQEDNSMSRKYEGTGLGLAISRSLCRLMGYRLTVESKKNQGSTFSIILKNEPDSAV